MNKKQRKKCDSFDEVMEEIAFTLARVMGLHVSRTGSTSGSSLEFALIEDEE